MNSISKENNFNFPRILVRRTILNWRITPESTLTANRIHFKYWENILISRFYEQLSRNGSAMAPERLFETISNFKKYEHVKHHLKARGLEIPNI